MDCWNPGPRHPPKLKFNFPVSPGILEPRTHYPCRTNPPKETMNDSLKLAYTLNLATWRTVAALLEASDEQALETLANTNIETLEALIEAQNAPKTPNSSK